MVEEINEMEVGVAFFCIFKDLVVGFIDGLHALQEEGLVRVLVDLPLAEVVCIFLEDALDVGSCGARRDDGCCSRVNRVDPWCGRNCWEGVVVG